MGIDKETIIKLEKLAKISLSNEERGQIGNDLDQILNMIDKLSEIDTTDVEPLIYMHEEKTVLRNDASEKSDITIDIMNNAPKLKGRYFTVPKVIDKN
ncbi:MAG: Asp-tRNA(Asn)/Glu-tRNA(Gln) amidotransferase subunit GatC [Saprospiraceae bacterium]